MHSILSNYGKIIVRNKSRRKTPNKWRKWFYFEREIEYVYLSIWLSKEWRKFWIFSLLHKYSFLLDSFAGYPWYNFFFLPICNSSISFCEKKFPFNLIFISFIRRAQMINRFFSQNLFFFFFFLLLVTKYFVKDSNTVTMLKTENTLWTYFILINFFFLWTGNHLCFSFCQIEYALVLDQSDISIFENF